MRSQELGQPSVPNAFDGLDAANLRILTVVCIDEAYDPLVFAVDMRVRTVMVTHQYAATGLKFRQCALDGVSVN